MTYKKQAAMIKFLINHNGLKTGTLRSYVKGKKS